MAPDRRIGVAHFRSPYLSRTETFIHSLLTHANRRSRPTVFTSEIINRKDFPFDDIVSCAFPKLSREWWISGIATRLMGTHRGYFLMQIRKRNIAVLHAHFGPQGWEILDLRRETGLPLVTTFYGYDLGSVPRSPEWPARYRALFKEGDLFLVEGSCMKKKLMDLGCAEEKIRIQRIGIDLRRLPMKADTRAPGGRPVFLFCGRFVEKKGLIYALQACELLKEQGLSDFTLRIIGNGPLDAELRAFAAEKRLGDVVEFLGPKTQDEYYAELQASHIFVAPSITAENGDNEGGAPTTILEAQAAGRPVLATTHADIPEVVAPGKSALLAPERDAAALAANMRWMLENRSQWEAFGRAGRAHVEANHDIVTLADQLEGLYETLVRQPRVPITPAAPAKTSQPAEVVSA